MSLDRMRKVLAESTSMAEAMAKGKWDKSQSAMERAFRRQGLGSPGLYLKKKPVLHPDPIKRKEKQEHVEQIKKEHAQLVERVREAEARQAVYDRLGRRPPTTRIVRRVGNGKRDGTAVVLASDWHVEEYVPRRSDTGGNFYDLREADKRVGRFFNGVSWLIDYNRPAFGIHELVLWLGGDLMTGYLRDEDREENQLSPVQTLVWLQKRIMAGIDHLLEDGKLERIVVVCSHGNHGRTTEKRQIRTGAKNSYEWLLYQWLATHYADNKRVCFVTDLSNHQYIKVYDYDLHFTHGDEVKFQGGIGGIAVPLMKAVAGWDQVKRCDYHHMGHWHQLRDFGNVTVNGSLIGYNAYAMSVRATPEPPQQAFYILDSKRGKTASFPIWVAQ